MLMNRKQLSSTLGERTSRGMTLVEILVTVVLISVGLLGIAALQLTTLRSNQEALIRSQASELANDILDRMRANQAGFLADQYNVDFDGTGPAGTAAGNDLAAWQAEIDRLLPGAGAALPDGAGGAAGRIQRTPGTNIVTITIRWSEREDRVLGDASGSGSFETRSEV